MRTETSLRVLRACKLIKKNHIKCQYVMDVPLFASAFKSMTTRQVFL
jgi:hypothetical protein